MDFYIKQNATLPHLMVKFVNNPEMQDALLNSKITFSMTNQKTKDIVILCATAVVIENPCVDCEDDRLEPVIVYKWKPSDTKKPGHYTGEFTIKIQDGTNSVLKVPILENLNIHIQP